MKISQFIDQLKAIERNVGDLEVFVSCQDSQDYTAENLSFNVNYVEEEKDPILKIGGELATV